MRHACPPRSLSLPLSPHGADHSPNDHPQSLGYEAASPKSSGARARNSSSLRARAAPERTGNRQHQATLADTKNVDTTSSGGILRHSAAEGNTMRNSRK